MARLLRHWRLQRTRLPGSLAAAPPQPATAPPAPPHRPWDIAATLVIGAIGAGILASALSVPLADWDGRMIWSALAETMRHEGTATPSVLGDAHWFVMHPRYPPLLPVAQAAVQETFGAQPDEQLYRALYVAFFAALLMVLRDGAGRAAGSLAAALATVAAALPHFLGYGSGGAASAYSDLPLAAFYGGALVLLLLAPRLPALGLAGGCLLAGAVLAKNEGELLAGAALLLAAARLLAGIRRSHRGSQDRSHRPGTVRAVGWFAAAALPVLAATALLASWRAGIPNRFDEDYFAVLRLPTLLHNAVALLPAIGHEILRLSFRGADWQGLLARLAGRAAGRPPRPAPACRSPHAPRRPRPRRRGLGRVHRDDAARQPRSLHLRDLAALPRPGPGAARHRPRLRPALPPAPRATAPVAGGRPPVARYTRDQCVHACCRWRPLPRSRPTC